MFEYKKKYEYRDKCTTFGSITVKNVVFEPSELQKVIPNIILEYDTLMYIFDTKSTQINSNCDYYSFFLPEEEFDEAEISKTIARLCSNHNSYGSYIAEVLLALICKDLYGYKIAKGILDVTCTNIDTRTGADVCMYDLNNELIILGEAKFYQDLTMGFKKIFNNFTNVSLLNKLKNLLRSSKQNVESFSILMKEMHLDKYKRFKIEEFLNLELTFAGFVLHSAENINRYNKKYYESFDFSSEYVKDTINSFNLRNVCNKNINLLFIHLPIHDKVELLTLIVREALNKLKGM